MIMTERKSTSFPRWLVLVGCVAWGLAAPDWAAAQSRFSGIVVFGTSLSDPGNAFVLVGDANTPPDFALDPLLIPSAPYAKGGHHFSNGATWVEHYARSI
jgi:phospholipase/lecithinase/hemolysin